MSTHCWKDGDKFVLFWWPSSLCISLLLFLSPLSWGYYKAIHAVAKQNTIELHFDNVKTKCFGISEVKHFIKNAASECFDIFEIRSPPPPVSST